MTGNSEQVKTVMATSTKYLLDNHKNWVNLLPFALLGIDVPHSDKVSSNLKLFLGAPRAPILKPTDIHESEIASHFFLPQVLIGPTSQSQEDCSSEVLRGCVLACV